MWRKRQSISRSFSDRVDRTKNLKKAGIELNESELNERLKARMEHAKQFHPFLTIWFKKDGCQGKEYAIRVNQFKKAIALPLINIELYNSGQLTKLNQSEIAYNTLRGIGYSHLQTLKHITSK